MHHEDRRGLDDHLIIRPSHIYVLLRKMRSNQFTQDLKKCWQMLHATATLQGQWQIIRLKLLQALKVKNLCFAPEYRNQFTRCTEFSFLILLSLIYPRDGGRMEVQLKYSWSSPTTGFNFIIFFYQIPCQWSNTLILWPYLIKKKQTTIEKSSLDLVKRPNNFYYTEGGKVFLRLCILYQ